MISNIIIEALNNELLTYDQLTPLIQDYSHILLNNYISAIVEKALMKNLLTYDKLIDLLQRYSHIFNNNGIACITTAALNSELIITTASKKKILIYQELTAFAKKT